MADPRPTAFGKYLLGERLAVGGMAELFNAEVIEGHFDGPIVLKRMLPALASHEEFVAMFVEEARISTCLDHPNIVKVHDFDASDRGLFLVMELVDGPDLLSVLARLAQQQRRMEPELAAYIACHVLEALDYAHNAASPRGERLRIVHRDVSPSNVLITRRGQVKLADFGIARASSLGRTEEIAAGTLKGKFGYMSPEQVRGEPLDGRSDVFSMGIVLAEMLIGRRLFSAPEDVELLLSVRRGDLSRLDRYGDDLPDELDAIVRRALAVELDERYRSADAFREALVDWLAGGQRRTGAGRLAQLLRELEQDGPPLCSWKKAAPTDLTISGTRTKIERKAASNAAQLGRIEFARIRPASPPPGMHLAPYLAMSAEPAVPAGAPDAPLRASRTGELEPGTVVDLLCDIVRCQRTCALVLRTGALFKEAYFASGHPVFVRSNVLEDRFGEFLVQRGVLSRDQLDRVLAVLDRFGGRMGQALASLELVRPVDAVRLLADQVSAKLVSACAWQTGSYELRDGEPNPWPALELELRTYAILAKVLPAVPAERLVAWFSRAAPRPVSLQLDGVRPFELEWCADEPVVHLADGRRTLRDLVHAMPTAAERTRASAIAYVLCRCGVLRLAAPA